MGRRWKIGPTVKLDFDGELKRYERILDADAQPDLVHVMTVYHDGTQKDRKFERITRPGSSSCLYVLSQGDVGVYFKERAEADLRWLGLVLSGADLVDGGGYDPSNEPVRQGT